MSEDKKTDLADQCLHCVIIDAIQSWREAYVAKNGDATPARFVGACIGGVIEDIIDDLTSQGIPEANDRFVKAIEEGRVMQRKVLADQKPANSTQH